MSSPTGRRRAAPPCHPGLLGAGIDERTAVTVQRNTMTAIGREVVRITDGADHDGLPYDVRKPGARFDLASWRVL
jgi:cyanophycinase-like exopeptidase